MPNSRKEEETLGHASVKTLNTETPILLLSLDLMAKKPAETYTYLIKRLILLFEKSGTAELRLKKSPEN